MIFLISRQSSAAIDFHYRYRFIVCMNKGLDPDQLGFEGNAHSVLITRGIWKVLSMVFYLSNRFTNPNMFGII